MFSLDPGHQHIKCRSHPVEKTRPSEAKGHEPERIRQQVVRPTIPTIRGAFKGPAHGVVPQRAIRNSPRHIVRVLNRADNTNRNSEALRMRLTLVCCVRPCPGGCTPGGAAFVESQTILGLDYCDPVKNWHGRCFFHLRKSYPSRECLIRAFHVLRKIRHQV